MVSTFRALRSALAVMLLAGSSFAADLYPAHIIPLQVKLSHTGPDTLEASFPEIRVDIDNIGKDDVGVSGLKIRLVGSSSGDVRAFVWNGVGHGEVATRAWRGKGTIDLHLYAGDKQLPQTIRVDWVVIGKRGRTVVPSTPAGVSVIGGPIHFDVNSITGVSLTGDIDHWMLFDDDDVTNPPYKGPGPGECWGCP